METLKKVETGLPPTGCRRLYSWIYSVAFSTGWTGAIMDTNQEMDSLEVQ
jgi:hypothetical protein